MNIVTTFLKDRYKQYLLSKLCKLRSNSSVFAQLAVFSKSTVSLEKDYMESCLSNYKLHPYDSFYLSDYNHHFERYSEYMNQYNFYFSQYELCNKKIEHLEEKLNNL